MDNIEDKLRELEEMQNGLILENIELKKINSEALKFNQEVYIYEKIKNTI